jgi:hypothetical protein
MARDKIEIMSVRSELNKVYRIKYGMFWRFKRNKIQLEIMQDELERDN